MTEEFDNYIPPVCSDAPLYGKAFCKSHTELMANHGYETNLRSFLESCGTSTVKVNTKNYTKEQQELVKRKLNEISRAISSSNNDDQPAASGRNTQGIYFLRNRGAMNVENFQLEGDNQADSCSK